MKKALALVLLISVVTTSAFAEENTIPTATSSDKTRFIGGDLGSVSGHPNTAGDIVTGLTALGWTSVSASQSLVSSASNIHGGKWLSDTIGWEVGYNSFGSAQGSFTASTTTQSYFGSNTYSASSIYAAMLGATKLGSGKAYVKAGMHSTSTKTEYTAYRYSFSTLIGTSSGSTTKSNTGFVLGAGYEYPFNSNWAIRLDIAMFTNAQFASVADFAVIKNQTLVQSALGVNYNF